MLNTMNADSDDDDRTPTSRPCRCSEILSRLIAVAHRRRVAGRQQARVTPILSRTSSGLEAIQIPTPPTRRPLAAAAAAYSTYPTSAADRRAAAPTRAAAQTPAAGAHSFTSAGSSRPTNAARFPRRSRTRGARGRGAKVPAGSRCTPAAPSATSRCRRPPPSSPRPRRGARPPLWSSCGWAAASSAAASWRSDEESSALRYHPPPRARDAGAAAVGQLDPPARRFYTLSLGGHEVRREQRVDRRLNSARRRAVAARRDFSCGPRPP